MEKNPPSEGIVDELGLASLFVNSKRIQERLSHPKQVLAMYCITCKASR